MTRGNLNPGEGDPNRPPAITIAVAATAAAGQPVALTANVTDDGLPKPRVTVQRTAATDATRIQAQANSSATPRPRGLTVTWMQLRGPTKVTFDAAGPSPVAGGTVVTTARFPSPGVYAVRATASDGAANGGNRRHTDSSAGQLVGHATTAGVDSNLDAVTGTGEGDIRPRRAESRCQRSRRDGSAFPIGGGVRGSGDGE